MGTRWKGESREQLEKWLKPIAAHFGRLLDALDLEQEPGRWYRYLYPPTQA